MATVGPILPSVDAHIKATVTTLFDFIIKQGDADYIGEAVSQLEHSLQAAFLAHNANADDETILGALLHDIGRFIPQADEMPAMIAPDGTYVGREAHEIVGEKYLRQLGFSEKICQLVGAHVMAKRYLCAVEKEYWDGLSQSSKTTLKYQGGIFNDEQVKACQKDPWLENKLAVRKWDDQAKDPSMWTPPLSDYQDMAVKSLLRSRKAIKLHGRSYNLPAKPTVVICVDGFDPEYLTKGIESGVLPNLAKFAKLGFHTTARGAMPSFTNPNNVSIITGVPPSVHGINGNFFLDRNTNEEVMVKDASLLRGSTILSEMSNRGIRVAAVTAKDKLRKILAHGLNNSDALCFSAEAADTCAIPTVTQSNGTHTNGHAASTTTVSKWLGLPTPTVYSGNLSLFVLSAGINLLSENRSDLLYLTLSDYIQHKHAPGTPEADAFMSALDTKIGELVALDADVAITGDHGMSDKSLDDGRPNVIFLQDVLERRFGPDCSVRVVCPITDPYVKHHGALGSFVRVYLSPPSQSQSHELQAHPHPGEEEVLSYIRALPGIQDAHSRSEASRIFENPYDVEADIVVVAEKNVVIGSKEREHDLSSLGNERLRSHGGWSEQEVPLLMSRAATGAKKTGWRNFDVFDLVLNH